MITRLDVTGYLLARVITEFEEDPTMGCYTYVVEVMGLAKSAHTTVRVGAPMAAANKPLLPIELTSVVQLLLSSQATVADQPSDEIDGPDHQDILRRWRTYDVTSMGG